MKDLVEKGLSDWNEEKTALVKQWAGKFSWQNAAKQYWEVYKSIL